MPGKEDELRAREEALNQMEEELKRREEMLKDKPFSQAMQRKKESWYSRLNVSVHTMDIIIGMTAALLGIVVLLIVLEAAGIYKLSF